MKDVLILSNPKPLRNVPLVQEIRYKNLNDPTNLLGFPSLTNSDIRTLSRWIIRYNNDYSNANDQYPRFWRWI